ncbi:histone deacetylase 5 [Artemisia annua]|uniref:histone deacetylase n=1 Tax=Artemisia annua TaxID=35608 RepID=A0A2U1MLH6_ARTAN|nr:histone deacetylase 5 [Artemisia annua]
MEFAPDETNENEEPKCRRVGLVYDERMCKHSTPKGKAHPENPNRISAVWNKLVSAGIPQRCVVFKAKEVEDKYIAAVHSDDHINLISTISYKNTIKQRNKVAEKYDSIYFNEGSSESAYLAAGSVVEAAEKVAKGELNSAFAIVRPPGHHAERSKPMGLCLYNNVAIAASFLLDQKELGISKILIVDWDVHHGNGTQEMFYKDSRVLVFSVHRHEHGLFYPGGENGSHKMVGEGPGLGYNINVPWENGQCGDEDYIAVWDHILIPVAEEFNPDIILVSAGFDAAVGDPLGGCLVTPYGYSIMLKKLMDFSDGKIVLALEGGYHLDSLAKSVLACMEVLLEDQIVFDESSDIYPFESTWRVIKAVREELGTCWPILAEKLPKKLTSRVTPQLQRLAILLVAVLSHHMLMDFSEGKIVLALEGGYHLDSLAKSVLACMEVLLEDQIVFDESSDIYPFESTWQVIKAVREELGTCWPILAEKLPKKLTSRVTPQLQMYRPQSDGNTLLKVCKRQRSSARNSASKKMKKQSASDILGWVTHEKVNYTQEEETSVSKGTHDSEDINGEEKDVEDPESRRVLKVKRMSNAELAAKMDEFIVDSVSVMTEAAQRMCRMDNNDNVNRDRIQKLKARAIEDGALIEKQRIAIKESEKHLQSVLEAEKRLKDELLAERAQHDAQIKELMDELAKAKDELTTMSTTITDMASEIVARDKTLIIKDKEIEILKQQFEAKALEDIAIIKRQEISIKEGEKHLQSALNREKELKDELLAVRVQNDAQVKELKDKLMEIMTANTHMASDIVTRDKALIIKDKESEVLEQQLRYSEIREMQLIKVFKTFKAHRTEALKRAVKAENDRFMLLSKWIRRIVNNVLTSCEFLDPIRKCKNLANQLGRQQALKSIQETMLPNVALEKMPGYDNTVTERYKQAAKECQEIQLPYLTEIAANANKSLEDIMKLTPKKP